MQYEECSFEEATHARLAGGKVVELDPCMNVDWRTWKGFPVDLNEQEFKELGITPLRKVEVKPIEFLGAAVNFDIAHYIIVPHEHEVKEGTLFKCVEILEDEQ